MIHTVSILLLIVLLLVYIINYYTRFRRHGVNNLRVIPLLGNIGNVVTAREHMVEYLSRVCNTFPDDKFIGSFELSKSVVIVKDVELLKKVAVRDFEHFLDHMIEFDEKIDPLFANNLFSAKGQKWKDMRAYLSPAFTSAKIRLMVPFMVEAVQQMIESIKEQFNSSEGGSIEIQAKDLVARCANDIIASCAFGIKVNTYTDEDNQFFKTAKYMTNLTRRHAIMFLGAAIFPGLFKMLKITFFSDEVINFFNHVILDTMKERAEKEIVRHDMIHLLMKAKQGKLFYDDEKSVDDNEGYATVQESEMGTKKVTRVWTDSELVAQAVVFYVGSLDTVTSSVGFTMHELAVNPDIQERLYQEILQNEEHNNGKLDYESIQSLKYLDMVVSESLRMWPLFGRVDRNCIKDYNFGKPNPNATEDFIIRKGEGVIVPIWCFHRNPEYFPNPDKFDPERFSIKNRDKIKPYTYMPFGMGPRSCIGSRFALCEIKVIIYLLLLNIKLSPGKKTIIPLKLQNGAFNMTAHGGYWMRLTPRLQKN